MSVLLTEEGVEVDLERLNDARWGACNTPFDGGCVPTIEKATECGDNAVRAYLGITREAWRQVVEAAA